MSRDKQQAVLATKLGEEAVILELGDAARCTKTALQISPAADLKDVATGSATESRLADLTVAAAVDRGGLTRIRTDSFRNSDRVEWLNCATTWNVSVYWNLGLFCVGASRNER